MPEVHLFLAEGRSDEQKRGLVRDVTDAVVSNLGSRPENVVVQIIESKSSSKARGGILFSDR